MKRIMAIVGLLLLMLGQTVAEEHLVMHFDFENVDGKNVTDPVSGITAMSGKDTWACRWENHLP